MNEWIDLMQFAAKYGVSPSTLRRRIRANTISFRMERGKYLLPDSARAVESAPLYARGKNPPANAPKTETVIAKRSVTQSVAALRQSSPAPSGGASLNVDAMEYARLQDELRRLQATVAEQETLIRALEAELRN